MLLRLREEATAGQTLSSQLYLPPTAMLNGAQRRPGVGRHHWYYLHRWQHLLAGHAQMVWEALLELEHRLGLP